MQQPRRILLAFHLPEALRDVLQGVTDYAKQSRCNWHVLCVEGDEFNANFSDHRADGAIIAARASAASLIRRIRKSGTPVVNMLHNLEPRLPSVLSDDVAIGRAGADYLLGRGFRDFAFVGIDTPWSLARQTGFTRELEAVGRPAPLTVKHFGVADFRFTSRVRAIRRFRLWVRTLPAKAAVMTACDFISRTLLSACEAEGIDVPGQLAILGVDNFHTVCELSPVPLSSVAQDFTHIGFESAALLDRLMRTGQRPPGPVLVPPGRIQVRTSTNILAYEDPTIVLALDTIHKHASTGISVKELLRQVPMSRKWFDHRFKQIVGHTPSREIRMCRMRFVRDLLMDTNMSLSQIALHCRFSCAENLNRCFRAAFGMPPQAYRLNARAPRPGPGGGDAKTT